MKRFAPVLLAATACAGSVTLIPRPSEQVSRDLDNYYDHERSAADMIAQAAADKKAQENPVEWWRENAVLRLEKEANERLQPTGDLVAACLHTRPGEAYTVKGRMKPDQLYDNDIRFYDTLVRSNNQVAERYKEVRALINVAEKQYSYKDDFRALALRGIVAYERLLDHHRFILGQIQEYDCLSGQAAAEVKFEDEALKTYQGMVKNVKRSGDMLKELQGMVDQEFDTIAKPLADKKAFANKLDLYSFERRVFGENLEEVDAECRALSKTAPYYAFKLFACGYVAEKGNHDSKAKKFYAVAKSAGIEYAGPAAQRTSYLDDWGSPLQTDEARKAEGQSSYQIHTEYK